MKNIFRLLLPIFAASPSFATAAGGPVLLRLEDPPRKIMVGENYTFYVTVQNVSERSFPLQVEFTVRDGSVTLDDIGVGKVMDADTTIKRIPSNPRSKTTLRTTSTALCGWGNLDPGTKAKCAFDISGFALTLESVPFVFVARDTFSGRIVASHVTQYRVNGGEYATRYLHYRDFLPRTECAGNQENGRWTQQYADCYRDVQRRLGAPSYPTTSRSFDLK